MCRQVCCTLPGVTASSTFSSYVAVYYVPDLCGIQHRGLVYVYDTNVYVPEVQNGRTDAFDLASKFSKICF